MSEKGTFDLIKYGLSLSSEDKTIYQ